MVWSEEIIRQLRELWDQGLSTAEIGRRLGVSKNAIVGKAHRLDLTARPSPIRREPQDRAQERPTPAIRTGEPTLPPLPSAIGQPNPVSQLPAAPAAGSSQSAPSNIQALRAPPPSRPAIVPPAPPVRAVAAAPAPYRRAAPSCCWPIGEPGKKDFRFCDDVSAPGKPYCEEHAKLAYVKIRDRKEDAA